MWIGCNRNCLVVWALLSRNWHCFVHGFTSSIKSVCFGYFYAVSCNVIYEVMLPKAQKGLESIWNLMSLTPKYHCNTRLRSFKNACVRAEKNRSVLRIVGKQTGDCSSRTSPTKILPSSENVIMDHSNNLNTTILFQKVPPDDIVFVNDFCLNCHRCIFRKAARKWLTSWRCAAVNTGHWRATGDPLHSRAACTQPCNVNTHSRAHCSPGARLCEQWGARLCEQ